MRSKVFYSMEKACGIMGVSEKDGYEIEIDGEKFHAYRSERDGKVYIIDPQNGIALSIYNCTGDSDAYFSEIELIENAKEELIKSGNIKKWKETQGRESYKLLIQMFKAYKKAELLRRKQRKVLCCEIEEEAGQ